MGDEPRCLGVPRLCVAYYATMQNGSRKGAVVRPLIAEVYFDLDFIHQTTSENWYVKTNTVAAKTLPHTVMISQPTENRPHM